MQCPTFFFFFFIYIYCDGEAVRWFLIFCLASFPEENLCFKKCSYFMLMFHSCHKDCSNPTETTWVHHTHAVKKAHNIPSLLSPICQWPHSSSLTYMYVYTLLVPMNQRLFNKSINDDNKTESLPQFSDFPKVYSGLYLFKICHMFYVKDLVHSLFNGYAITSIQS